MSSKEPKENILERIRERQAASRKKLRKRWLKIGGGVLAIAIVLAILYPYLRVVWKMSEARGTDVELRKEALQWLADNKVRKAVPVFVEALGATRGESDIAYEALLAFKDSSTVLELLRIWKDTEVKPYGRYRALELVAELGGAEHMDTFTDPLAILSDRGWEPAYDFLNKHADERTVEKLLSMLDSEDEREERAAAVALRYLRMGKKHLVQNDEKVKAALAAKLKSPREKVKEEAAHALIEMAGEAQFDQLLAALDDDNVAVCRYSAMAIGYMKPELACRALDRLLEMLLHPDGDICTEAAQTLIKIGADKAISRLTEIVGDRETDSFSRVKAVEILKTASDPKAVEAITAALADAEASVARSAARALIRVGGRESVAPLIAVLGTGRSANLRIVVAYVLGLLAEKEAAPALIKAMNEGDFELSRVAGAALLRTGAREHAGELASMIEDSETPPVTRRDALLVVSKFRTVDSVRLTIDALSDEVLQVREEAKNAAIQLTQDLRDLEKPGIEPARELLIEAAGEMFQKSVGGELSESIKTAESFDDINRHVFTAMRRLDEVNKPDFDSLEAALEEAKRVYWTSLLLKEFAQRGTSQEQLSEAAGELRSYIENVYMPEEPPMLTHRKISEELKKKFGF